ncbi:MAG TPA: response regulator [Chloroflexota bacterium]|nr:response regulator [Chloroflexota bacterium]
MTDDKLRVLIVEDSLLTGRVLRDMIDAQPDMTVVAVVTTGQEAIRRAAELRPDVILMDIHLPDLDGVQATWLISSKNPDSSVIMVTSEERAEYMQRAMVAGAQGYVLKPVRDAEEIANTIRTVRQRFLERRALLTHPGTTVPTMASAAPAPHQLGFRIATFSAKGGQGKTTIAVNLALALRTLTDKRVVLVDADLRFGDANIFLDLPFGRSIMDLLPHIDQLDSHLLDQVLAKHPSGLQVLVRPERPELAETVTARHLEQVLTILPRLFDYVVIDCELSYDEKLLAVLDRADYILLVLTPDLGVVRNTKHFLELAATLGYPREKIEFVLNRANSNVGLSPADVERALGPGHYFRLDSFGRLLTTSLNMGQPAVLSNPRSDFARVIREIAERVVARAAARR